ncbi:MAG TPA: dihydrofolate reductase family protein [Leptospiraceae bacterium]|nr:dihydrofolate reductase family protein [Leptospiraceae bacterium]HMW07576.1 dihydrofolate reductase family protein [Leptospiraceae bacterium]HMX33046.1 dihydrofolate reductase family protein [Leptospiraceae bacterium]HMY33209.1 dihydrofolate reductase family protein [Leptospiraceae bacterium]HMZ65079.1 dihydrofolate reductase family protein [Leptospiraceae bacterium]
MRKIIAALNMTLDGFCDHTAGIPDEEIHQHYTDLLGQGDAILYGRITYELMEFWKPFIENPSDEKFMNEFATAIDRIPKIIFSHSLKSIDWKSARLANRDLKETVLELKQQSGKDILVGSRSLFIQLLNLGLLDELQICIHPVVIGKGLPLFDHINDRTLLKLTKTKTFGSGAILIYYEPSR